MRLLLADGTQVSVQTYTSTSVLVSGNTVPALSIVVNESLDKVKTLFSDENNLVDFNIYEDDKNVVLLHAIGYQKRVSISLGETDDVCTVTLAKTSETDVILKQVLSTLESIEKQASSNDETIKNLQDTVTSITNTVTSTLNALTTVNENYKETTNALDVVSKSILLLSDKQNENDKNMTEINQAISSFQETITGFTATVEGFRSTAAAATQASAAATASLDAVNKSYTIQDAKLTRISEESEAAAKFVNENGKTIQDASDAIQNVAKNIESLKKTVDATTQENSRLSKAYTTLTSDYTPLKENVSNMMKSVSSQTGKINSITNDVINVTKTVKEQNETIDSVKKTVNDVGDTVTQAAKAAGDAANKVSDFDARVTALEPVTDFTTLDLDDAKTYLIAKSATALEEYLASHPITSTCHGGTAANYSITKDKQTYLQSMISVATLAAESGVDYQPSWNATGEECTYDWTVEELSQLALEIEAVVRPLVSQQQAIENQIKAATTMDQLSAIVIAYGSDVAPEENVEATPVEEAPVENTEEQTDTAE